MKCDALMESLRYAFLIWSSVAVCGREKDITQRGQIYGSLSPIVQPADGSYPTSISIRRYTYNGINSVNINPSPYRHPAPHNNPVAASLLERPPLPLPTQPSRVGGSEYIHRPWGPRTNLQSKLSDFLVHFTVPPGQDPKLLFFRYQTSIISARTTIRIANRSAMRRQLGAPRPSSGRSITGTRVRCRCFSPGYWRSVTSLPANNFAQDLHLVQRGERQLL
eukprot:743058-Amorphochlora_amoeboformis.AAC.2